MLGLSLDTYSRDYVSLSLLGGLESGGSHGQGQDGEETEDLHCSSGRLQVLSDNPMQDSRHVECHQRIAQPRPVRGSFCCFTRDQLHDEAPVSLHQGLSTLL